MNIVLFDGVCNLCNATVRFLIKHDKKRVLYFASQQSEIGKNLILKHNISSTSESLIFIQDNQAYQYADAVLAIARCLVGWPKLVTLFSFIPRRWRNICYQFVARHRYQWFGKKESCSIPSLEIKDRFLK